MDYVMLGLATIGMLVVCCFLVFVLMWAMLSVGSDADDWVDLVLDSEDFE